MLFALGLGDSVVAVTHECDHPAQAATLPHVTRSVIPDGLTAAEVRRRLAAQAPVAEKRRVASAIIDNSGDLTSLARQVDELLADLPPVPANRK